MINKINKLSRSEFVKVFANIFENARWIADKLYSNKPFKNFQDLSLKIIVIFESSSREKQLKILQYILSYADGKNNVIDISNISGFKVDEIKHVLNICITKKLIK